MRKVVAVSLPDTAVRQVDRLVSQGGYASTSELFRDMIREWTQRPAPRQRFFARSFLDAAKRHARKGAPKTLSDTHDRYLYGA
jgi:Arc/MetJ-type ribon-helix-helix transcriptional regulator